MLQDQNYNSLKQPFLKFWFTFWVYLWDIFVLLFVNREGMFCEFLKWGISSWCLKKKRWNASVEVGLEKIDWLSYLM